MKGGIDAIEMLIKAYLLQCIVFIHEKGIEDGG
jgi:hypothetical protein